MICWKCHKEIKSVSPDEVYRTTECPFCHAMLHCCKGCRFYLPGNHFDCRENIIDPVSDKEHGNFCDYFSACSSDSNNNSKEKSDAAKAAFNALFGGIICL